MWTVDILKLESLGKKWKGPTLVYDIIEISR